MNSLIFVAMLFGAACAAPGLDKDAPIESQVLNVGEIDGKFENSWTGNGISVKEVGDVKLDAENKPAQVIQGEVSYTAPDGTPVSYRYYADDTGVHAEGSHVPVAPEIPQQIAKALEWAQTHPYNEEAELKKTYN